MKKIMLLLFTLLTGVGCATTYKPAGFKGGYSELQLQNEVYEISFRGNAYISSEKVRHFVLYRAAELTLERGYEYFTILDSKDDMRYQAYTSPTYSTSRGDISATSNGSTLHGSTRTTTTTYGGDTTVYSKPYSYLKIKIIKEKKLDENGDVFNARELILSLQKRYKELRPK